MHTYSMPWNILPMERSAGKTAEAKEHQPTKPQKLTGRGLGSTLNPFQPLSPTTAGKNTGRRYLGSALNANRMHRIYVDECDTAGVTPVSCRLYRDIFNKEYNLSFHRPKKDQCLLCGVYFEEKRSAH